MNASLKPILRRQIAQLEDQIKGYEERLNHMLRIPLEADGSATDINSLSRYRKQSELALRYAIYHANQLKRLLIELGPDGQIAYSRLPEPEDGRRYPRRADPGEDGAH